MSGQNSSVGFGVPATGLGAGASSSPASREVLASGLSLSLPQGPQHEAVVPHGRGGPGTNSPDSPQGWEPRREAWSRGRLLDDALGFKMTLVPRVTFMCGASLSAMHGGKQSVDDGRLGRTAAGSSEAPIF